MSKKSKKKLLKYSFKNLSVSERSCVNDCYFKFKLLFLVTRSESGCAIIHSRNTLFNLRYAETVQSAANVEIRA